MTGDASRNLWLKYNTSVMRQIDLHVQLYRITDKHPQDSPEVEQALGDVMDEEEAGAAILRNLAHLDGILLVDHLKALEALNAESPPAERQQQTDKLLAAFALPQIPH